jgi:hypothetical protein
LAAAFDGGRPGVRVGAVCDYSGRRVRGGTVAKAQKAAFLHQPFRLQHHHLVTFLFAGADFWVVEPSLPSGAKAPAGRFYLDRSAPVWHVIDIGFLPEARG